MASNSKRPSPARLAKLEKQKKFTEADMAELCSEPAHRFFDFKTGAQFAKGSLRFLAGLKRLQFLHFEDSNVTDADLKWLGQIKSLRRLDLSGCPVTSRGMAQLTDLPKLEDLWLYNTRVGDGGLKHIAKLTHLSQDLNLDGTLVTDRGLKTLLPLKELRGIGLSETKVTDHGILVLAALPRLCVYQRDHFTDTGIEGFVKLQRELKRQDRTGGTKAAPKAKKPARPKVVHSNDPKDPDVAAARKRLFDFFEAMNQWERWRAKMGKESDAKQKKAKNEKQQEKIHHETWKQGTEAMQRVFDEHCVPRLRPYGRGGAFQQPPTYAGFKKMKIVEIERRTRSTIIFYTNKWSFGYRYQFILKKKGDLWLVDNKKYFASGGWSADYL